MSKHKHFHDCRNVWKLLQHGHRERIGPMDRVVSKSQTSVNLEKETAPSAANTESGKQTPESH